MKQAARKSLVLVGSGIKTISHLTTEVIGFIKGADLVLYLVNEPLLKKWIKKEAKEAAELDEIYFSFSKRIEAYQEIQDYILKQFKKYNLICVVIYGHPTVFASPGLDAIFQIEKKRIDIQTLVLPGISALDCLFSDLRIDPGVQGCFSIEVNDLILYLKNLDPFVHNVIWQVGMIGNIGKPTYDTDIDKLNILQGHLLKFYDEDHVVILYEASIYPKIPHKAEKVIVSSLYTKKFTPLTTLYIPPSGIGKIDKNSMRLLGLSLEDLSL